MVLEASGRQAQRSDESQLELLRIRIAGCCCQDPVIRPLMLRDSCCQVPVTRKCVLNAVLFPKRSTVAYQTSLE